MADTQQVSKQEPRSVRTTGETERVIRPAVDIFEDDTGITVKADMPGVSKDKLDIRIDRDALSIEGEASISTPENMEALYADVHSTRYQRSFALSSELDTEKVDANLKDGVLTLRIHKREEHKPRRIEVQSA
ncbi:MAG: Hsp20/alpha crystallin family protein [Gammaproteobacteria bacterium]|jgi:HSP20 family molecular chaperone IbpA